MASAREKLLYENEHLLYSKENGIAKVTMNDPATLNAISPIMEDGLRAALADAWEDSSVRVVLLTGAGRGFSSGANVKAWDARLQSSDPRGPVDYWRETEARHNLMCTFQEMPKPTIAMVNGAAVGMGADLAFACDMRIASDKAKFGMFYILRGLVPYEGGSWFLPRLVGPAKACEMLFTGDLIDGQEAARIGLVNRCVSAEELEAATMELAQKIAGGPPVSIEFTKQAIWRSLQGTLRENLIFISNAAHVIGESDDVKEGMRAFVEKRKPVFVGR